MDRHIDRMMGRITSVPQETQRGQPEPDREAHRIDEVLEELFTQYGRRFPGVGIVVVETPAAAV